MQIHRYQGLDKSRIIDWAGRAQHLATTCGHAMAGALRQWRQRWHRYSSKYSKETVQQESSVVDSKHFWQL